MRNNSEVRQQMFKIIEQWKQSGLSQKVFCQQQLIDFHKFSYWYKCYRRQHGIAGNRKSGFVKLKIEKSVAPTSVEIHFPDGVRLLFHEPVSLDYLKMLIR